MVAAPACARWRALFLPCGPLHPTAPRLPGQPPLRARHVCRPGAASKQGTSAAPLPSLAPTAGAAAAAPSVARTSKTVARVLSPRVSRCAARGAAKVQAAPSPPRAPHRVARLHRPSPAVAAAAPAPAPAALPESLPAPAAPSSTRPPKRPARSRRLRPEALDPEDPANHADFYPTLPTSGWEFDAGVPTPQGSRPAAAVWASTDAGTGNSTASHTQASLPACYHPIPGPNTDGQTAVRGVECGSSSGGRAMAAALEVEGLRRSGGFLKGPQQVAALLQPRQPPSARQLLGLGLDYADHFFEGPDYRYAVDEQGRLIDMVAHVRTRVPARFDRARPASGAAGDPVLFTASAARPARVERPQHHPQQHDVRSSSAATNAPSTTTAPATTSATSPTTTHRSSRGEADRGREDGALLVLVEEARAAGAEPLLDVEGEGRELLGVLQGGEGSNNGEQGTQQTVKAGPGVSPVDGEEGGRHMGEGARTEPASPPVDAAGQSTRAGGGGYLGVTEGGSAAAGSGRLGDAYLDDATWKAPPASRLQAPLVPAGELAARRPLVARNVAASRRASPAAAARGLAGNRGSALFRAVPIPPDVVLRVFTYCIGPTELFQGLWDLELLEQVRYVQRVEDADVVVHKRPQPGEKQFAYQTFRQRARALGIPFVSLWSGSAAEVQRSLLPVFVLYAGLATPEEVALAGAPGGRAKGGKKGRKQRGKGARRIRL